MKTCAKCGEEIGGRDGVDDLCPACERAAAKAASGQIANGFLFWGLIKTSGDGSPHRRKNGGIDAALCVAGRVAERI